MGVMPAEANFRCLDVLAEGQNVHPRPRFSGANGEVNPEAQAPGSGRNADAAGIRSAEGAGAVGETERTARLLEESVVNVRVAFQVDGETGDVTVKVIDNVTGKVVRYIPPEELEAMTERLKELAGLVVDIRR